MFPVLTRRFESLGRDVLDVAFAAVQRLDDRVLHVDEQHALAGFGEGGRKRDADVAGADDGDVVETRLGHGGQEYRAAAMRPAA